MKTILVAEDQDASRELIRAILQSAGYIVMEAKNGAEAVSQALHTPADMVILDLWMPDIDGFGVLKILRADSRYVHKPIVALTASAMTGDREQAISEGFSEYFTKPVNVADLRRRIARLFEPAASDATA